MLAVHELQAQQAWAAPDANSSSPGNEAGSAAGSSHRQLHLPLDSAEQLPAGEAVIAALYDVPDALSSLQQQQLVDAVVLADKLGAPKVAQRAVDALKAAAQQVEGEQGLTGVALEALASLPSWPTCLYPLLLPIVQHAACCVEGLADLAAIVAADTGSRVQRMLLAVLGDLEAVWKDVQLQRLLLLLPLPAAQLLLSSDDLRIASEDTVLYTANMYITLQPSSRRQTCKTALALLVRAPHLTRSGLAAQTLSSGRHLLLDSLTAPLKQLVSYKLLTASDSVTPETLSEIRGAPDSWSRNARQRVAAEGVCMQWRLSVEKIAQACRQCFANNTVVSLNSPGHTPPLGGVVWRMQVHVQMQRRNGVSGVTVGLYLGPGGGAARNVFRMYSGTLECASARRATLRCDQGNLHGRGYPDFFRVGLMSEGGGWDEATWAAKGLPTSGEVELSLHMHSVG
jgi:hypothetical protein